VSANPHGLVGHSEFHDIEAADDPGKLMTGGGVFSVENGKNVRKKVVSAPIREFGSESGNLEMDQVFEKGTG